jgi:hypothetical protein
MKRGRPGYRSLRRPWRRVRATIRDTYLLLHRNHEADFDPAGERQLASSDFLGVLAGPEQISRLIGDNQ